LSFKTLEQVIDPNACPVIIDPNVSAIVFENFAEQLRDSNNAHKKIGNLVYKEQKGNSESIDQNDVSFRQKEALQSKINSFVAVRYLDANDPNTEITDIYELMVHANPAEPNNSDVVIGLSVLGDANSTTINSSNYIRLWVNDPNKLSDIFNGKPLTLQELNINDVNDTNYPVHDLRQYLLHGLNLSLGNIATSNAGADPNKTQIIKLNSPYKYFTLSTTRKPGDLNRDNAVTLADAYIVKSNLGKTGNSIADVADADGTLGIPNEFVDINDGRAVTEEIYKQDTSQPYNWIFGFKDNFENGIKIGWKNDANHPWKIDSNYSKSGKYSARSGVIGDNEKSALELNVNLESPATLKFNIKTSGSSSDEAVLYIDNKRISSWAGELSWKDYSRGLSVGQHNVKIVYEKDPSVSKGKDAVWLDNFEIIPNEYLGAN
jgi:hypothetical protein